MPRVIGSEVQWLHLLRQPVFKFTDVDVHEDLANRPE